MFRRALSLLPLLGPAAYQRLLSRSFGLFMALHTWPDIPPWSAAGAHRGAASDYVRPPTDHNPGRRLDRDGSRTDSARPVSDLISSAHLSSSSTVPRCTPSVSR